MRIGDTAMGVVDADADTGDVWGSLGPLLNGLKSHDGASLAASELREDPVSRVLRGFEGLLDWLDCVERIERIEDCEGEVPSPPKPAAPRMLLAGPSGGNVIMICLGLSSIGAILVDMIELRCETTVRLSLELR